MGGPDAAVGPGLGRWSLLAIACAVQAAVSVLELGLPIMAPLLRESLSLSGFELGLLLSALSVGRLLGVFPSGVAVDRLGERVVMLTGGVGVAVSGVVAAAGSLPVIACAFFFLGLFASTVTPAGSRLVLAAFPHEERGLPMGIRQAAIPMGAVIAAVALGPFADEVGWRTALAVGAVVPFTVALAAAAVPAVESLQEHTPPLGVRRRIVRDPAIVMAGIWSFLFVGGQFGLLTYLGLYLIHDVGTSLAAAFVAVAVCNAAGIVGRPAWGWLSDARFESRRVPGLLLITVTGIVAAVALLALPAGSPPSLTLVAAAVAGLSLIGWQGLWVTLVAELGPPEAAGTTVAYGLAYTNSGVILWPPLLGLAADLSGSYRSSWALLAVILGVSLVPLSLIGSRRPSLAS